MFDLPCVILNFFVFPVRASKRCVLAILRPPSPSVQHADDCAVRAAASRFAHFACSMQPPPPTIAQCPLQQKGSRVSHVHCIDAVAPAPPVQHANDYAARAAAKRFAYFAFSLRWCRCCRRLHFLPCLLFILTGEYFHWGNQFSQWSVKIVDQGRLARLYHLWTFKVASRPACQYCVALLLRILPGDSSTWCTTHPPCVFLACFHPSF